MPRDFIVVHCLTWGDCRGKGCINTEKAMKQIVVLFITDTGCIAAGMDRAFSHICLFVRALRGKRLELSVPKLVDI